MENPNTKENYLDAKTDQENAIQETMDFYALKIALFQSYYSLSKSQRNELSINLMKEIRKLGMHWIESIRVANGTTIFK